MRNKKRILVINHEFTQSTRLVSTLENSGYRVTTTDCENWGLNTALLQTYHLIVIDLDIENNDCLSVLRQVQVSAIQLPIFILTPSHKDALTTLDKAISIGVPFQILKKPIGGIELLTLTESVLNSEATIE